MLSLSLPAVLMPVRAIGAITFVPVIVPEPCGAMCAGFVFVARHTAKAAVRGVAAARQSLRSVLSALRGAEQEGARRSGRKEKGAAVGCE